MKAYRGRVKENIDRFYGHYRPLLFGLVSWSEFNDPVDGPKAKDYVEMNVVIDEYLERESQQDLLGETVGLLRSIVDFLDNL